MEPRALHVLGKQSNTELDASETTDDLGDLGWLCIRICKHQWELLSWNSKEMSIVIYKVHPDEEDEKLRRVKKEAPFCLHLPKHTCSCRNLREKGREGRWGKVRREYQIQPWRPDSLIHTLPLPCASLQFRTSYLTLLHTVSFMSSPGK